MVLPHPFLCRFFYEFEGIYIKYIITMNESIKIKISGSEYEIKKTFRSLLVFEEMTGLNAFDTNNSIRHFLMYFYSILKANNKHFEFSFEQFVDLMDENPDAIEIFSQWLQGLASKETEEKQTKPSKKKNQ